MARKWFSLGNTSGLTPADIAVLNRAARHFSDQKGRDPSHLELVILRTAYVPGMSANELLDRADGE